MRLLAATLVAIAIVAPANAQKVEAETFVLDNGMKFILVPRNDQPNTISAGWLAKVGSVNERPGITGISHFFEHMMFKGTNTIGTRDAKRDAEYREEQTRLRDKINELTWRQQYQRYFDGQINDPWDPANDTPELKELREKLRASMDAQQGRAFADEIARLKSDLAKAGDPTKASEIQTTIDRLQTEAAAKASIVKDEFDQVYTKAGGSGMNAFTSHDLTFYFITVPSNKFELWAWMESDRLNDSVFREFFAERDVVHEERRLRTESTPTGIYDEQFDSMFWIASGYSWPVIGWPSDLNSYTFEEAQRYWDIYYRPNNLVGFVVGDFNPAEVKPVIQTYFSRLRPGREAPPPVVTLERPSIAEMRMNAEVEAQPSVEIRWHTVPFGHKDSYPLSILAEILNGRTGRLYKSMIEGTEVASSAGARADARKYAGAFSISAETKGNASPAELEAGIDLEVKRLQDELVSAQELQKIKNQNAANQYRRLQSNMFLMIQLAFAEAMGSWEEINEQQAKLDAVTAEDIQRVAREYLTKTNRAVATYVRKAATTTATAGPDDAEIAKFPPQMQGAIKEMLRRLAEETDAEKLRTALAEMESQIGSVPEPMKKVFEFMREKMTERLEQIEKK